jgi:hypothetical protein
MAGPLKITVRLTVPIMHGDEELTELELHEPQFRDLRALDKAEGDFEKALAMVVACTKLPPSVIGQLYARDVRRIGEEAAKFMGEESPPDGSNSADGSLITSIGSRVN